ncbi:hypothetical protein SSPIM334S_01295 [Streptomyces spiroverticillatus]
MLTAVREAQSARDGDDHPDVLDIRRDIVAGHLAAGNHHLAQEFAVPLLDACTRVLGPDHVDTLNARAWLLYAWLRSGRLRRALAGLPALVTDQAKVLGEAHITTLNSRSLLADALERAGEYAQAVSLAEQILDRTRALGARHPQVLNARTALARQRELAGDRTGALRELFQLHAEHERHWGPDHAETLEVRDDLVWVLLNPSTVRPALRAAELLVEDCARTVGGDHGRTLEARSKLASACGHAGDYRRSLRIREDLVRDCDRVLGPHHHSTLEARKDWARAQRWVGKQQSAVRILLDLVADSERVRGADHTETLSCRLSLALAVRESGDLVRAADLLEELRKQCEELLPEEHTRTSRVRGHLIWTLADSGLADRAVPLARQSVADVVRLFGADHPRTWGPWGDLGHALLQGGEPEAAREVLEGLLPSVSRSRPGPYWPSDLDGLVQVHLRAAALDARGADGPEEYGPELTALQEEAVRLGLVIDFYADYWGGGQSSPAVELARTLRASGRPTEAVRLLQAVHSGRACLLGPDHPDTLESHAELVLTRLESDAPVAPEEQHDVLDRHERALGPDHPETEELRWRLRTARPARRPRLTLRDETAVGRTSAIEVRLERNEDVPAPDLDRVEIVADCRTDAVVAPAAVEYVPGGPSAVFAFTPRQPGAHPLRFAVYDHDSGLALQELETVVHVPEVRGSVPEQGSD